MVAAAATSAIFQVPSSSSPECGAKSSEKIGGSIPSIKSKSNSCGRLKVNASAKAPFRINGTKVGLMENNHKTEDHVNPSPPRTFINTLPDWSMLLAAITTMFLAAEKQWMMIDWKPKRPDILPDPFSIGRIVQDGLAFRQNFSIRSYEIGADRTASIETIMNHLQETALNHVRTAGLLGDGFGSTPEMSKRNLIWVVSKMQVLVDRYPTWGDTVQVDTWVAASGKNGMRRDWLLSDARTGNILTRASSIWVMMNKETRRLAKIPYEVRDEIESYFVDSPPVVVDDNRKLPKLDETTANSVRSGLTPRWSDLDVNQHVNNVKYVGWILESTPLPILEGNELTALTMEYRRECRKDSIVQSLTSILTGNGGDGGGGGGNGGDGGGGGGGGNGNGNGGGVECQHLLRLETGAEIVKARTEWRPKSENINGNNMMVHLPIENA